jgi:LysM repeat protein
MTSGLRRIALTSLAFFALLVNGCASPVAPAPTETNPKEVRSATVNDLVGSVEGRPSPQEALAPIVVGFRMGVGGQVQTGDASRVRLDLSDGSIMRLAANSSFTLQDAQAEADGSVIARVRLNIGKLFVSLFGGEVQVETPAGVASVRGSFAVFQYSPGDPDDPDDDWMVLDCLEGDCEAHNDAVNEQLGSMERIVLGPRNSLRLTLIGLDVQNFLRENPESERLIATLAAAPSRTPSFTPSPTPTASATFTPPPTDTPPPTPTFTPAPGALDPNAPTFPIFGQHTVRAGETLLCIARGYGVLPGALAAANGLSPFALLQLGQVLRIPAVQWQGIAPGPVCATQIPSPFPGLPTSTPTTTVTPTSTTSAPSNPPAPTATKPPAQPTATPDEPTATPDESDSAGPDIRALQVSPTIVPDYVNDVPSCQVTFLADIADPSGVREAYVEWSNGAQQSGSAAMKLYKAPYTWQAQFDVTIAYGDSLRWKVRAVDEANNGSLSSDGPVVIADVESVCPSLLFSRAP